MTTPLRLAADLGQANDPTALAALHCTDRYEIRQLGRLPLGTPYPEIAQTIVKAAVAMRAEDNKRKLHHAVLQSQAVGHAVTPEPTDEVTVYVDATGVGAPVVDMLLQPLRDAEIALIPVVIAAGDEMKELMRENRSSGPYRYVRVGKEYMVGRLQALLQNNRIVGAASPEFEEAKRQLLSFQRTTNARMHDQYGAKSGAHDDLVIALALGVLDEIPTDAAGLAELNANIPGFTAPIKGSRAGLGEGFEPIQGPQILGWHW